MIEVRTFRKKPVEIQAVRFTGWDYGPEIAEWCGGTYLQARGQGEHSEIVINTLEGTMCARVGDWVIKGVEGEFYPCKDSVFRATYEQLEEWEDPLDMDDHVCHPDYVCDNPDHAQLFDRTSDG